MPILKSTKRAVAYVAILVLRLYLRYAPVRIGKAALWKRVFEPYLGWRRYTIKARTRFGAELFCQTNDFLQRYIYFFGWWEPRMTGFFQARLREGDTLIDVGANIGYFSLLASRLVGPAGKVVSIEASPAIFSTLKRHLEMNRVANVRALNAAVSDRPGSLWIGQSPQENLGGTRVSAAQGTGVEVKADRLGNLLTGGEVGAARIIKIDVEGFEWRVLQGLYETLPAMRPDVEVVCEIDPEEVRSLGGTPEQIFDSFRAAGFHAYCLADRDASVDEYTVAPQCRLPRISAPPAGIADVVFSRVAADFLV